MHFIGAAFSHKSEPIKKKQKKTVAFFLMIMTCSNLIACIFVNGSDCCGLWSESSVCGRARAHASNDHPADI